MKKWLSILLMCSMLVGSLAGCGSGGKTEAERGIRAAAEASGRTDPSAAAFEKPGFYGTFVFCQ